jgi:hypothetical protein
VPVSRFGIPRVDSRCSFRNAMHYTAWVYSADRSRLYECMVSDVSRRSTTYARRSNRHSGRVHAVTEKRRSRPRSMSHRVEIEQTYRTSISYRLAGSARRKHSLGSITNSHSTPQPRPSTPTQFCKSVGTGLFRPSLTRFAEVDYRGQNPNRGSIPPFDLPTILQIRRPLL